MKKLALLLLLLSLTTLVHADAISGSFPVVLFQATENGANLQLSTTEHAVNTLTSSIGTGDFAAIPVMTSFGPFSLDDTTVGAGGGFSMFNALYGSFSATSGSIVNQSPNFLDVRLLGVFDPGPAFTGEFAADAVAHISFTRTGSSLSGSYTLATTGPAVPEPSTLMMLGSGLVFAGFGIRRLV